MGKKYLDIYPINIGKRVLVFFCDLIITFFIAFILFSFASYPIGKIIVHYDEKVTQINNYDNLRSDVLIGNKVLFYKSEETKHDFNTSIKQTFDYYLAYLVPNTFVSSKDEYNIYKTYFIDIKNNKSLYMNALTELDKDYSFFKTIDEIPILQDNYKTSFKDYFDPNAELGDKTKEDISNFQNHIFLKMYQTMLTNILEVDLTYQNHSYINLTNLINSIDNELNWTIVICTYIGFVLACFISYFALPFFFKGRRTISMLFIKVNKFNIRKMELINRKDLIIPFFYSIITNAVTMIFIPIMNVNFNYLFNLPTFVPILLISALFLLISIFVAIFNAYNKTLTDLLSMQVYIDEDTVDEIYKEKGYDL